MIYADTPFDKAPYIKGKGFMEKLCPVALHGIPKFADSRRDKRVLGTVAHENWWKEQLYYIHNGLTAGGHDIPGRFYYYMNFGYMSTINGVITPDMVDLHLELAHFLDYGMNNGVNLLMPKGRRKGISEATHKMIVDYGWRFSILRHNEISKGFKVGVASGEKKYVDDFLAKWRFGDSVMPPELRIKAQIADNDDEIIAGYQIKNESGAWVEDGTFNTIYARTAHAKSNIFKGLYLNAVISEEIGEHENWFNFFGDTKDCLMSGNIQKGCFIGYGTGGDVNKGSKDFKKISEEAEFHNFIEFVIPATRFYFYGGASRPERALPADSTLYDQFKPYQLIGVEDRKLAEKTILDNRAFLLKSGNLKKYNEELQNNPINKAEIFRKTVTNNFNINKMNAQVAVLDEMKTKKYSRYILEWERDDKGMIKVPYKVKIRPAAAHEEETGVVYILDAAVGMLNNIKKYKNAFVAGIDSYNIDTSKTSKSLGAMVVLVRKNGFLPQLPSKGPVALIRTRPPRKEKFYEMCLQMSVLFDLTGNVLGDIRSAEICGYFKDWGGEKYLAKRPAKFEAEDSTQTTDYWFAITKRSKPEMVGVIQTYIEDHIHECYFPVIIDELQNYDEVEIESDNDAADALGIALIQDISCDVKPKDSSKNEVDKRFKMPEFEYNEFGDLIMIGSPDDNKRRDPEEDYDGFGTR